MATRRNRIKGIANIPQRRKIDNTVGQLNTTPKEPSSETDTPIKENSVGDIKTQDVEHSLESNGAQIDLSREQSSDHLSQNVEVKDTLEPSTKYSEIKETLIENFESTKSLPTSIATEKEIKQTFTVKDTSVQPNSTLQIISDIQVSKPLTDLQPKTDTIYNFSENKDKSDVTPKLHDDINVSTVSKIVQRRTFIKPVVNVKLLAQKLKPKLDNEIEPITTTNKKESETSPNLELHTKALLSPTPTTPISDSENTSDPLSPTKLLNRSRIKAVPRLHRRRISMTIHGSASESEDDTRKSYKRVKTESMCSTTSSTCDQPSKIDCDLPQRNKDFSTVIQRKCRRTEQSNKMAEARRNFLSKFRNKTPDKHNLTMLDLIFYNPTTKPMTQKLEKSENKPNEDIANSPTECDSPEINEETNEENVIPAPQIKIGENGEIIIDEQSLVVENTQVKKDRETLQKSDLINGDFDTGYGIYKRVKRAKDWSKEETLFFYKALNTLGTDFSLMVQLFPGRTRKQLKLKFKKEERINHVLIDKALTRPLQFNIKELKEELENKKRKKELQDLKKIVLEPKDTTGVIPYTYRGIKKVRKVTEKPKKRHKRKDIYSKLEKGIASVWESSNSEDELSDESLPENNLSNILKPTRYGRVPKQKYNINIGNSRVVSSEAQATEQSKELEPGSFVIVCCPTLSGAPSFKVFMVTPTHTKVPVDLPHDLIDDITKNVENKVEDEQIIENNYTICHDPVNVNQDQSEKCNEGDQENT